MNLSPRLITTLFTIALSFAVTVHGANGLCFNSALFKRSGDTQATPGQPNNSGTSKKIKDEISKIGIGGGVTINLKNNDVLHGTISHIDTDNFEIAEIDRRIAMTISYDEVNKVRQGIGNVNVFTGKRVTPSRKRHVIGLIIATAVIAIPVIIAASSKD